MRRTNLSEEVADRLISSILKGRFKFGQRLPSERDLARYLDVGRPTLREAIRTLSVIGMVEVRRGEGTFVVDRHSAFVAKAFSWTLLLDARTAQEVVESRVAIETELARLAALRARPEHIAALNDLIASMEASGTNGDRFLPSDLEFHLTIARAAENLALRRLLEAIQALLRQWIRITLNKAGTFDRALDQHRTIVAAIEAHDPERADTAMRLHLEEMGKLLIDDAREREAGGSPPPLPRIDYD